MQTIFIKSKKNKLKIAVGQVDYATGIALFPIKEMQVFHEAECFGIDEKLFEQNELKYNADMLVFRFGLREIWIPKQRFLEVENSWIYPKKDDPNYVANKSVFEPKRFISFEKAEKIKLTPEEIDIEKAKRYKY